MEKYKVAIFDLDGTLTDSYVGIFNSLKYAFNKLEINPPADEVLKTFIGPTLHYSFKEKVGLDDDLIEKAVIYYREYFENKGWEENALFEGIKDLLKTLDKKEIKICLATTKPKVHAVKILQLFEIDDLFYCKAGANLDGTMTAKIDLINYVLDYLPDLDKKEIVMIGDRHLDIEGANSNGLDSIGVTYGYGKKKELEEAGATFIAESIKELKKILTG